MSRINQALRQAEEEETAVEAPRPPRPPRIDAFPEAEPPHLVDPPISEPEWPEHLGASDPVAGEALLVHEQVPRLCTEQFRALAGALHQKQRESGIKTLMITSAHANEGKTFTAANLALMLGESYRRRVLLIDADLRRPCLHAVLGVPNVNGLADGLRAGDGPVRVTELSQWLAVLPGGTPDPDPMPSLTSGRLKPIVEDAVSKFDWVIIDTPPVALLPDASLVGSLVQGVILVVGAGLTPYRMIGRAVETLGRNKILGVVLNRVEANRVPEGSYDHYYGTKSGTSGRKKRFWNRTGSTARP